MRMFRWISGQTRKDMIRNEDVRNDLGVVLIEVK